MGQQIQIAATAADEKSFLDFLRESADIQLFVPCAPTVEELWVDAFAPFAPYYMQYWIWNKAYAWTPKYGRVNEDVKGRGGWPFVSNNLQGPVIEFSRTDVKRFPKSELAIGHGRIYWAKYNRQKGFQKWFDAILRWVRRTATNLFPKSSCAVYCLPDAWGLWQARGAVG